MVLSNSGPFQTFAGEPPSPHRRKGGDLLVEEYTDEDFCNVF